MRLLYSLYIDHISASRKGSCASTGHTKVVYTITVCLDWAMNVTGEVTLTGRVLPVGGIKEKLLAARRSGIQNIIFPGSNRKDYDELNGPPYLSPASALQLPVYSV